MQKTKKVFREYLKNRGLKITNQRRAVIETFWENERHFSLDELYEKVREKNENIGRSTVYRTLKLLCEAGIAREVEFGDKITRYEHALGHEHHDHLVCVNCGRFYEVSDGKIEELQNKMAEQYGFKPVRHRLEIFGVCRQCREKARKK